MRFHGKIVAGRSVGRTLGFPTLNFEIPENFESEEGVFAAQLFLGERKFPAILFFGNRETFDNVKSLEIHVLEKFDESPASAEFEILGKIREVERFENEAELKRQITKDCQIARKI
jgi:riboflavin kinase/FMN adenylyltransferase